MQQVENSPEKLRQSRINQMVEFGEELLNDPEKGRPTSKQSFTRYIGLEAVRRFRCTWTTGDDYAGAAVEQIFEKKGWRF